MRFLNDGKLFFFKEIAPSFAFSIHRQVENFAKLDKPYDVW